MVHVEQASEPRRLAHVRVYIISVRKYNFFLFRMFCVGRDTRLDGPGIESWWGRDFPHPSRPVLWPALRPVQWIPGLFPGDKAAGAWI